MTDNSSFCQIAPKKNCYETWKTHHSRTSIIPSNSRPIPQLRKWQAPVRPMPPCNDEICQSLDSFYDQQESTHSKLDISNFIDDGNWSPSYIPRRTIHGASKHVNANGQTVWYSGTPNPIKHWRKQLFPRQGITVSKARATISQTMDRPGCTITNDPKIDFNIYKHENFCPLNIPVYIDRYLPENMCEKDCSSNLSTLAPIIKTKSYFTRYYHRTSSSYLQSRVKLYRQRAAIQFNRNRHPFNPSPPLQTDISQYASLYKLDVSGCFTPLDCSCIVQVIYKPNNKIFAKQNPAAGSLYTKHIKRTTINKNQYNITNRWGLDGTNTNKHYPLLCKYSKFECAIGDGGSGGSGGSGVSGYLFHTKAELQKAINLWISDKPSALSTYGEINTWNVSLITDMSNLFNSKTTFNDDISNWDPF